MPEWYVEHGDTAGDRNTGIICSGALTWQDSGAAVPRLNSDKSFVVSKETDIQQKNKMFKGGAAKLPCLILFIDYSEALTLLQDRKEKLYGKS